MTDAIILGLLAGMLILALAPWIGTATGKALARKRQPPAAPVQATTAPRWQALPGGVIELADTGYLITHHPADMRSQYVLITPEGAWLAKCSPGSLAELKAFGELVAGERGEFVAQATTAGGLEGGDDLSRALAALRRRGA